MLDLLKSCDESAIKLRKKCEMMAEGLKKLRAASGAAAPEKGKGAYLNVYTLNLGIFMHKIG